MEVNSLATMSMEEGIAIVWAAGRPMDWERERLGIGAAQASIDANPLSSPGWGEAAEATAMLERFHGLGGEVERWRGRETKIDVEVECVRWVASTVDWGGRSGEGCCRCCWSAVRGA